MTWAAVSTATPMGQQYYESEVQRALQEMDPPGWAFHTVYVTSLRGGKAGVRRSPQRVLEAAPLPLALTLGAALYRTRGLVHRFDLRLPPNPGREVVTAHDLPPARFDDEGTMPVSMASGARRARAIIAPSQFAADELQALLGVDRPVVIPYGLSRAFSTQRPVDNRVLQGLGIREPYVLHAAGATKRKNLPALAKAWQAVAHEEREVMLVLCGPQDARRDDAFAELPRVVMPGMLEPETVAALMCRAAVVVVPSLYEGFGLPALEGMACGRPVVAARRGALPEVCADAALLVEPDPDGLAEGLLRILRDDALAGRLRAAGPARARQFSWQVAAQRHLDVYAEALAT